MRVRRLAFLALAVFSALGTTARAATPSDADAAIPIAPPAAGAAVSGLVLPVDAPLVLDPALLPGAPRDYRAGVHEGIDFAAPAGAPVRAALAGTIVRIDRDYVEWSVTERARALSLAASAHETPGDVLDRLRGRQVWVDHGGGLVTRYAHLASVADRRVGDAVAAGEVIGAVGESGYPEGGTHLHFEVRVGDGYLGESLPPDEVVYLVAHAFSPATIGWRERE